MLKGLSLMPMLVRTRHNQLGKNVIEEFALEDWLNMQEMKDASG